MATQYNDGFALPTVIIASVIMMTLLLSGLVATTSISSVVRANHYNTLAAEAAEAGIAFMQRCASADNIPSSGTFTPKSTSCSNAGYDANKSLYLLDSATANAAGTVGDPQPERVQSTYTVEAPTTLANDYYQLSSTGVVTVHRPDGSIARTYTVERNQIFQKRVANASSSSSGSLFVCGIVDMKARCWGRNQEGQVGTGTTDPGSNEYYQNAAGDPITNQVVRTGDNSNSNLPTLWHELSITAGGDFACAVTENSSNDYTSRKVVCWGRNQFGKLGNSSLNIDQIYPYPKNTQTPWESNGSRYPVSVKSSYHFACVLAVNSSDSDGKVWCWGTNGDGQLGQDALNGPQYTPVKVVGTAGSTDGVNLSFINFSANARHVCGHNNNGLTVCWGDNEFGQVGNDTSGNDVLRPSRVRTNTSPIVDLYATHVAAGGTSSNAQSCAVGRDTSNDTVIREGSLWCWGSNNYGQNGAQGSANSSKYKKAQEIPYVCVGDCSVTANQHGDYVAKKVAVANDSVCAYIELPSLAEPNDRVACWGSNYYGELGLGDSNATPAYHWRPQVLSNALVTGKTVNAIEGGGYRFCAVVESTNYCWGRDQTAQVGDGEANDSETAPKRSIFLEPDKPGIVY